MNSDINAGRQNVQVTPIRLGRPAHPYALITHANPTQFETTVTIARYDAETNAWQSLYSETVEDAGPVKFYNQEWDATGSEVLVLYNSGVGSGGFVSYDVFGEENGNIIKYVGEKNVFQGSVFFRGTHLIRGTGNQYRGWVRQGQGYSFTLVPYRLPLYPGSIPIRYSIPNKNTVRIRTTNYTVPVGSLLQFVREDFNPVSERTLFSSQPMCIEFVNYSLFRATCQTKAIATIIPDGYNWDGAKEITITVV